MIKTSKEQLEKIFIKWNKAEEQGDCIPKADDESLEDFAKDQVRYLLELIEEDNGSTKRE